MIAVRNFYFVVLAGIVLSATAVAQTPGTAFTYQGRLDNAGIPANGTFDVRFTLYNATAGGTPVGAAYCADNVTLADGLFTVALDFGAAAFNGEARWLQIEVRADTGLGCADLGGFVTLAPRQPLTAAPYALGLVLPLTATSPANADVISLTSTGSSADCAQFNIANPANPGEAIEARTAGSGDAIQAVTTGTGRAGFFQIANPANATEALFVTTNGSGGRALFALSNPASGPSTGIFAQTDSTSGSGVVGRSTATTGTTVGVAGETNSRDGIGVWGVSLATSGSSTGVAGITISAVGRGVYGSGGPGTGVLGETSSGVGVLGRSNAVSGVTYGVRGETVSQDGSAVYGSGGLGIGVVGEATRVGVVGRATGTSGVTYGVRGEVDSPNGYAGHFAGNVRVFGTLFKDGGSFRIDHPLDPANKYLSHSFVESPDMMNIYNGNVVTDERGYATITMPVWFEALNRDFRYQLTVIDGTDGDEFVHAKVVRELAERAFTIRTSRGGVKVSWQVTGIRQDPWAEAHRIPVEQDKRDHERGRYQHPELYGQPAEMGINHNPSVETTELKPETQVGERGGGDRS